jgi:hypothetical protein
MIYHNHCKGQLARLGRKKQVLDDPFLSNSLIAHNLIPYLTNLDGSVAGTITCPHADRVPIYGKITKC